MRLSVLLMVALQQLFVMTKLTRLTFECLAILLHLHLRVVSRVPLHFLHAWTMKTNVMKIIQIGIQNTECVVRQKTIGVTFLHLSLVPSFPPNWPECSGDTDIDPPTGGDLGDPDKPSGGGGGGSTDPDKPEPDVDNTSDTLAAIKAMNKDVNSQLTGINNDMNKNQAETKSALDALKASVDLNTDTVVDNANHVANAIKGQSDMLSGIGNQTNGLLTSANNLLNNGFGQLSNDLGDLEATNQKGFGDVVDAIEGLGKPMVDVGGGADAVSLYSTTQLHNLNAEVSALRNEYQDLLKQYRAYFNFTSDVNGGDYNAYNIELTVRGNVVRQQNAVMAALQDNAGIIGAVVLFVFGLLGIRAIGGAF